MLKGEGSYWGWGPGLAWMWGQSKKRWQAGLTCWPTPSTQWNSKSVNLVEKFNYTLSLLLWSQKTKKTVDSLKSSFFTNWLAWALLSLVLTFVPPLENWRQRSPGIWGNMPPRWWCRGGSQCPGSWSYTIIPCTACLLCAEALNHCFLLVLIIINIQNF